MVLFMWWITNALIGHMQHNARDPNRDHKHGRIYRVTYPSRPLVKPAKIHGATIAELLNNLERYSELHPIPHSGRELRGRDSCRTSRGGRNWPMNKDERLQLKHSG